MPLNFLPPVCQNHNIYSQDIVRTRENKTTVLVSAHHSEVLLLDSTSPPVPSPLHRASVEFSRSVMSDSL